MINERTQSLHVNAMPPSHRRLLACEYTKILTHDHDKECMHVGLLETLSFTHNASEY